MATLKIHEPFIGPYPSMAALFSVLREHEKAKNWFFNNYLQLVFYIQPENDFYSGTFLDGLDHYGINPIQRCPYLRTNVIFSDLMTDYRFQDIVKELIDKGYYILTHLNRRWLTEDQEGDAFHRAFIFGYDPIGETIDYAEFFSDRKYSQYRVPYSKIDRCFFNGREKDSDFIRYFSQEVFVLKINDNMEADIIDRKKILTGLASYLDSSHDGVLRTTRMPSENFPIYYGLDYYDQLALQIRLKKEGTLLVNFQVLCDHKKLMVERTRSLHQHGILSKDLSEKAFELYQSTQIVRSMVIRHLMAAGADDLIREMESLREEDRTFVKSMIRELEKA